MIVFDVCEGLILFKMVNCGAPDCTKRSTTHPNHKFHLIPAESRDKPLREKWLAQIKRKEIPKYLYICSDHFEAECYEKDLEVTDFLFYFSIFRAIFFTILLVCFVLRITYIILF